MLGKTIKLYLVEGSASGITTVEIMNWTGKATVCPRTKLADLATRKEANKTGIYILAGEDIDNPLREVIYIGESENVINRLRIHNNDPKNEFWTKTLIFTNKDDNLTKGHVRYLESRLIQIATLAKRAKLENSTSPDYAILPESDIADMEYFIEQIKLLLPVLGFTFALPLVTLAREPNKNTLTPDIQVESPLFKMVYAGSEAYAREINNEFVIFQDSTIRKKDNESLRSAIKNLKNQLILEGKLIQNADGNLWTLTENLPFNSPSGAAAFVGGTSLNGRQTWTVKETGQTYEHWQGFQLSSVDED